MSAQQEETFRNYTPEQAARYAQSRGRYPPPMYDILIKHHTSHGGELGIVLDIGCGTGTATRALAEFFDEAIGADPSPEMVVHAGTLGGKTKDGREIQYEIRTAEEIGHRTGYVDLLTAAMAVHWFDMNEFWQAAATAVKPGGSVAVWTRSHIYCYPSTPNAAETQAALDSLDGEVLRSYVREGNDMARNMYDTLKMPWDVNPPVDAFPREKFKRFEWNRDGKLEPGEEYFVHFEAPLAHLAIAIGTASQVTRWREAHPDLAGTEEDCVTVTMKKVARAMGHPEEDWRKVTLKMGISMVLLMLERAAN